MKSLLKDRRIFLALGLLVSIATVFWAVSRYPALNHKAMMAGSLHLADPLSFEAKLQVQPDDPWLKQVAYTAGNWMYTNRQGMLFGVLLAAGFMTIVPLFRGFRFRSSFANTLLGVTLGTPLGVCVNCAAPIARGLHAAGASRETTLATMISSPTLNMVVITMLVSLFPLYMVLLKLSATIIVLVFMIPLLCRVVSNDERLETITEVKDPWRNNADPPQAEVDTNPGGMNSWRKAGQWVAREFFWNLWFILKTTVPLMMVAGCLAAAAVTVLPWERLVEITPFLTRWQKVLSLALVSALGLFLPVPIAFDVFLCSALYSAGMPAPQVMALLFTLGIFSVYSYLIIGRAMSWRIASAVLVILFGFGLSTGVSAHYLDRQHQLYKKSVFLSAFSQVTVPDSPTPVYPRGQEDQALAARLRSQPSEFVSFPSEVAPGIRVDHLPFRKREMEGGKRFARLDSGQLGFHELPERSLTSRFLQPFTMLRGIAAGDVHDDGWVDLLLGTEHGLFLYANLSGERFELQEVHIPSMRNFYVSAVALVDLNNDGWLDIFFATFREGNFVVYNQRGRFLEHNLQELPKGPASLVNAVAFGDLDRDGDLDLILGNWTSGDATLSLEQSRNLLLRQRDGVFHAEALPGVPGETLSTLLSDFNHDGHLDLVVGNDFDQPDIFYVNDGAGKLARIRPGDKMIPHSTLLTMSVESADVDNDLDLDMFLGQIALPPASEPDRLRQRAYGEVCTDFEDPAWRARCERSVQIHGLTTDYYDIDTCREIGSENDRLDCMAMKLLQWAQDERDVEYCKLFPDRWADVAYLCGHLRHKDAAKPQQQQDQHIPQVGERNVLLIKGRKGIFLDKAKELGLDIAGWTWNAKFADLDNDEWQDLFVVNGYHEMQYRESNVFFHNQGGTRFKDRTDSVGLTDFLATGAYAYLDFDNDGDLDIMSVPFDGPVRVYRNQLSRGQALAIELRDEIGNRFGIGSKIIVHYGNGSDRRQIRELKAGGGYLSFDPPVAYFGLGEHAQVNRVEIHWSTGEKTLVTGEFKSGTRYRVTREAHRPNS